MSLISEALKKARQEAARQDSLRQGVPYAVGAVEPPRRNAWMPLLAGLGAGCLLAALAFGAAWVAGLGPFAKAQPESQVAQAAPVSAPTPPPEATPEPAPVVTEAPAVAPTPPPAPPPAAEEPERQPIEVRPVPTPEPPAVVAVAPPPVATPAPPPVVQAPPPSPIQAAPAAPAPEDSSGLEEGKTYVGEVPVPGGGSVKLNGIAFSQDQPVAVLDGRVMGPGEVVQGFTVVDIQSNRVKLQGHGTTVFVTTK